MGYVWNLLMVVAGAYNAYSVGCLWHDGGQPDFFVYSSSILFSIGVAMNGLEGIVTSNQRVEK